MCGIKVNNLTKVYGRRPIATIKLLEKGKTKSEILEQTGMTVYS